MPDANGFDISPAGVGRISSGTNSIIAFVDLDTGRVSNDAGSILGSAGTSAGDLWFKNDTDYYFTTSSYTLVEVAPTSLGREMVVSSQHIGSAQVDGLIVAPDDAAIVAPGTPVGFVGNIAYALGPGGYALGPGLATLSVNGSVTGAAVWRSPPSPVVPAAGVTVDPASIVIGEMASLSWSSTDADTCTGAGFDTGGATSGSVEVEPVETTTYSVTCTGPGGTADSTAILTVTAEPPTIGEPSTLFFSDSWGKISQIDPENGAVLKTFSPGVGYPGLGDIVDLAGQIYGVQDLGKLYRISLEKDSSEVVGNTGQPILNHLVTWQGQLIAVETYSDKFYTINPDTGFASFRFEIGGVSIDSITVSPDGSAFVTDGNSGGRALDLHRVNLTTGEILETQRFVTSDGDSHRISDMAFVNGDLIGLDASAKVLLRFHFASGTVEPYAAITTGSLHLLGFMSR